MSSSHCNLLLSHYTTWIKTYAAGLKPQTTTRESDCDTPRYTHNTGRRKELPSECNESHNLINFSLLSISSSFILWSCLLSLFYFPCVLHPCYIPAVCICTYKGKKHALWVLCHHSVSDKNPLPPHMELSHAPCVSMCWPLLAICGTAPV